MPGQTPHGLAGPSGPGGSSITAARIRRLPGVDATSLTIVLPAYNEEARLGPALDELFGYLRRAAKGRSGLPGPGRAARPRSTCSSSTTAATDGTAGLVRRPPGADGSAATARV